MTSLGTARDCRFCRRSRTRFFLPNNRDLPEASMTQLLAGGHLAILRPRASHGRLSVRRMLVQSPTMRHSAADRLTTTLEAHRVSLHRCPTVEGKGEGGRALDSISNCIPNRGLYVSRLSMRSPLCMAKARRYLSFATTHSRLPPSRTRIFLT